MKQQYLNEWLEREKLRIQKPLLEAWAEWPQGIGLPWNPTLAKKARMGHPVPGRELSMIVIMAGLPGTGKSTLAQALARRLPGVVLDKDAIRAALFPPAYVEYSLAQDDFCQEMMLQTAAYLLGKNAELHVLLDGRTFSRRYQRERVMEFCSQVGTTWATLECVCSEATALARLAEAVAANTHLATNRTPELYREILETWEPIDDPKLVIDTDTNLNPALDRALHYLTSGTGA
jgi:predicted kinase